MLLHIPPECVCCCSSAYLNRKEVKIQAREKDVRARIAARKAADKEELSRRESQSVHARVLCGITFLPVTHYLVDMCMLIHVYISQLRFLLWLAINYKHVCNTHFKGITNNMYDFLRLRIHCLSNDIYTYPQGIHTYIHIIHAYNTYTYIHNPYFLQGFPQHTLSTNGTSYGTLFPATCTQMAHTQWTCLSIQKLYCSTPVVH